MTVDGTTPILMHETRDGKQVTLSVKTDAYEDFLRAKVLSMPDMGIDVAWGEINPLLKPHQKAIVKWALKRGRAAIFAAFGLGKTVIQLEILRLLIKHLGGRGLIVAPLGVRGEFIRDSMILMAGDDPRITDEQRTELQRWKARDPEGNRFPPLRFVRSIEECEPTGLYITNYESVRDGKLDPRAFEAVSLDEAAVLRGFGGTLTFRKLMGLFEGSGKYRFVATATPSPNDFIELLAYAAFLDIMDVGGAKTKWFQRNSEKADELTLMPHREQDFWLWCSTWAVFLQKPSELGYDDTGYSMPAMQVNWHEIPSDHADAGQEPSGQGRLLSNAAIGLPAAAREKRSSLAVRVAKMADIVESVDKKLYGFDQFIVWCELNDEQKAVDKALRLSGVPFSSLYGNQDIDDREVLMSQWRNKETSAFVSKSSMYGAGTNLQQAWHEIFLGVNYKFYLFIQAIHRVYRFGQTHDVLIDIIYTEAEREIKRDLERKWEQHKELMAQMSAIIQKYGLGSNALAEKIGRKMQIERIQEQGEGWVMVNNDCIPETALDMSENSVDLIVTSIPFSQQYEYSPSFRDLGHNEDNDHFWAQMDFLIPNLLRVLKPGRVAAIHVKDRITPSGMTGRGYQTVYRFSDECGTRFEKHGFGFLGRVSIITDVVRENNQTYRLGWTEQCKDGSRMGNGMPEYLMLFRKDPTDTSDGYADNPVKKEKGNYTRSRWQIDAHGFMRSNGNRYLEPRDFEGVPHERIFKLFRQDSMRQVYDFERHVELAESLERCQECEHIHTGDRKCGHIARERVVCPTCEGEASVEVEGGNKPCPDCLDEQGWVMQEFKCPCIIAGSRLPATFMLLQPQSWHPDVWTDVARMRTLNCIQVAKGREMHVCPMQLDIADRVIERFSMKGETVFDPFAGIGTVPVRAIMKDRVGVGCELSEDYFHDALIYLKDAQRAKGMPTLFDLLDDTSDTPESHVSVAVDRNSAMEPEEQTEYDALPDSNW